MAQFKIGDKVIKVDTNTHGTVIAVKSGRGRVFYTVKFPTGETNVLEPDLRQDCNLSDPFERCKNGLFGFYSDFTKKNTIFKIRNSNNSTISSLKASRTLFRPYQFKPLLKFLNSPNRRLLVADEVGLGKTIEAGHIMLELKARKELRNVLIICPKSLQEKWRTELYEKFGLAFKIIENTKDLIADLQAKTGTVRAIINYEKVRMKRNKDKAENNSNERHTTFIEYLLEHPQKFSLVLCDEAHKLRNRETQTYKGAEALMDHADGVLFLTATPIMISEENLYNLLHLLDNSRYFNYDIFRNRMNENRPFVKAISNLNHNKPLKSILVDLLTSKVYAKFYADDKEIYSGIATIEKTFKEDPIFKEIIELCQGEDTPKTRARLQHLFSSMSMMNSVFSRTRKREVTADLSQAERRPHIRKIELTPEEQKEFKAVIDNYTDDNSYTDYWGDERLTIGGALGLVQRKRQIASSVWGYLNSEADLDQGYDAYSKYKDAKVDELIKIVKKVFEHGTKKIVVFAVFRKTLKYLYIRLKKAGYNALVIHGLTEDRAALLNQFKTNNDIHILLSSEIGSEGLDMQFCNSMINYDLPWNPMVVEQRIGRIDRFGQKSHVVNIYNFVVAGSIQEEIYMRLLERIGIFHGTIGDMEAILDASIKIDGKELTIQDVYNKMEKDFFTIDLTKEERERKIAEVERAIANEKENLQHLQEGLSNTLTNDAYFNEEISRILTKRAYVTHEELENFLRAAIRQHLTTCEIEKKDENILEFKIPLSQPRVLRNFLIQYCDHNDESTISLNQFTRKIEDKQTFRITFSQNIAYEDLDINFLNIYHPMVRACLNYFISNEDENQTSFSYALKEDEYLKTGERYYMGLYQLTSRRMIQGVQKHSVELIPVLFSLQTGEIVDNVDIVNHVYSRSQTEGFEHNASNNDIIKETINDMSYDFTSYISNLIKIRISEEQRKIESDRLRNEQQTKEYYASRKANFENTIKEQLYQLEWTSENKERLVINRRIQLAKNQITNLDKECNERLELINEDKQLSIEDKLISLNLITII